MATTPAPPVDDLRPYQRQALTAIVDALADSGRATAVMACGTGKTLLGIRAAEALTAPGEVIAVFAPSLPLLEQLYNTWRRELRNPHRTILVCSQDDILEGVVSGDAATTPVTTNDDTITEYLTATTPTEQTVVFCTYHSAPRLASASRTAGTEFALLIADEAHRTAGKKNATFTTILSENQYRARRRLFMTATRRLHTTGADDALSMDDPALYGTLVYAYPFGRAIAEGWLSNYQIAVVIITDADVHRAILNETTIDAGGQHFNARRAAAVLALQDACRRHNLQRVLAFHNTVSASRQFTANLRAFTRNDQHAPINAYHLDALASPAARRGALKHLAQPQPGHRTVVNNVRVLAEGVDIPALDAVMFAEPKRSQIDVVQAVGRAIRKNPHRSDPSIILLPVYIAPGESPAAVLAGSQYRHIWQVIQALRDHDDTLDAQIRNIRRNDYDPRRPTYEAQALPEKILVYGTSLDAAEFTAAVETMILNTTTTTWAEGLAQYRIYTQQTGLHDVPKRHICATGFPLGQWQSQQRQAYRWKRLSPEQIADLEDAGFNWGERSIQWRTIIERINRYDTALGYRLSAGQLSFIDPPAMAWLWSVQDRGRRGLLSPREKDDLADHDITWNTQELADVLTPEETAIFGRPLNQFLNNATKHGPEKAVTMPVTIRRKHKNTRAGHHNITRWRGQQIADTLRNCAARGALPPATIDQIRAAGIHLPALEKPAIDLDTDPDWQNKLLAAVADLYSGRYRATDKPAAAHTTPNTSEPDDNPAEALTVKQLAAAVTGPTMADIGVKLNQITQEHPELPTIDVHATELIQQADCYSNHIVTADHRVLKPAQNGGYTPAGTLNQRIDTIALIRKTTTTAPTLTFATDTDPDEPNATDDMIAVRGHDISVELETELLQHISAHVYKTLPQLTQRLLRSTFAIRDVKIFNSEEEFTEFARRATRRNRVVVQIGPQLTDTINEANQTAAKMALAATYEKTITKLAKPR